MLQLVHPPVAPGVRDPRKLAVPVVFRLEQSAAVRLAGFKLDLWVRGNEGKGKVS